MIFTVKAAIRDLQQRINAERPTYGCLLDVCDDHEHGPLQLPPGVAAVTGNDYDVRPYRQVVILVRYTRREWGGWMVKRADNGRVLGWVVKQESSDAKGLWSAHVASRAFQGEGVDHDGALLDKVDRDLYNGEWNDRHKHCSIGHCKSRESAAEEIVSWLVRNHAPAVGYGPHRGVREYYVRAGQHFPLGEGKREHCSCERSWPCPKRAEMEAKAA